MGKSDVSVLAVNYNSNGVLVVVVVFWNKYPKRGRGTFHSDLKRLHAVVQSAEIEPPRRCCSCAPSTGSQDADAGAAAALEE